MLSKQKPEQTRSSEGNIGRGLKEITTNDRSYAVLFRPALKGVD